MSVAFREQDQELERELATLEQPPVSLREKIRSFLGQLRNSSEAAIRLNEFVTVVNLFRKWKLLLLHRFGEVFKEDLDSPPNLTEEMEVVVDHLLGRLEKSRNPRRIFETLTRAIAPIHIGKMTRHLTGGTISNRIPRIWSITLVDAERDFSQSFLAASFEKTQSVISNILGHEKISEESLYLASWAYHVEGRILTRRATASRPCSVKE